jgi:hypothetical protein
MKATAKIIHADKRKPSKTLLTLSGNRPGRAKSAAQSAPIALAPMSIAPGALLRPRSSIKTIRARKQTEQAAYIASLIPIT